MSFLLARNLIARLISLAILFQGVELLKMVRDGGILKVWSHKNLEAEMKAGLPVSPGFIDWLLKDSTLELLAWTEIALSVIAFLHVGPLVFLLLLVTHLLICVRFRGSLNGGSDAMTAIILIGLVLAYLFKKEKFAAAGLAWIAVNLIVSYLRADLAKARSPEWKDGSAFPQFLEQSLFKDIRELGARVAQKPDMAKYFSWGVIAMELLLPLALFTPGSAPLVLFIVVAFHFGVYWTLGLNRFFWVWLAAWPSVFYIGSLIVKSSSP